MVCFWQWSLFCFLFFFGPHLVFSCVGVWERKRERCKWSIVIQTKRMNLRITQITAKDWTEQKYYTFHVPSSLHFTSTKDQHTTVAQGKHSFCQNFVLNVSSTRMPSAGHSLKKHKKFWLMLAFPTAWLLWWSLFWLLSCHGNGVPVEKYLPLKALSFVSL